MRINNRRFSIGGTFDLRYKTQLLPNEILIGQRIELFHCNEAANVFNKTITASSGQMETEYPSTTIIDNLGTTAEIRGYTAITSSTIESQESINILVAGFSHEITDFGTCDRSKCKNISISAPSQEGAPAILTFTDYIWRVFNLREELNTPVYRNLYYKNTGATTTNISFKTSGNLLSNFYVYITDLIIEPNEPIIITGTGI